MNGVDDDERDDAPPEGEPTLEASSGEPPDDAAPAGPPPPEEPPPGETPSEPSPGEPPPEEPRRRLYREPEEKKLTGVCGGIADYLGADPTIVRLAVVVLTLTTRMAIVAYLVAAIVMPERPANVPRVRPTRSVLPSGLSPHLLFGLLIAAGLLLGVDGRWWFEAPIIGLGLIGVGAWLLLHDRDDLRQRWWPASSDRKDIFGENPNAWSDGGTTLHVEVAPERAHAGPPASDDTPGSTEQTEDEAQPVPVPPEPSSSVPEDSAHRAGPQGEVPPPVPPWGLGTSEGPPPEPPPKSSHGSIALAGLLLVAAGLGALLALTGAVDVSAGAAMAVALVGLGIALVVGAWKGRARVLIALGLPLGGLLLLADAADFPLSAGTGDELVRLDERSDLNRDYELLAGELRLDLRDLTLDSSGSIPTLRAEVFLGKLEVILPREATADVDALVGVGTIQNLDDVDEDGVHVEREFVVEGPAGADRIRLDLNMGLGELEVRRG